MKWNFREIGRTKIARSTLNPRYNASFLVLTPKNQSLNECSLDLELFDTSADGKNKLTDFLGCIQIKGDNLVQFLDSEQAVWMVCEKAKRFHGEENKHAKGNVFGEYVCKLCCCMSPTLDSVTYSLQFSISYRLGVRVWRRNVCVIL